MYDSFEKQAKLREIRAALALSEQKKAVALACRALEEGLQEPLLFYLRSKAHLRQGRQEEAAQDLVAAASGLSASASLRFACGAELIALHQFAHAIPVLEEAIRLDSNQVQGHFGLGWAYEVMGDCLRASACYETAVILDPAHAGALARLSCVALRMGNASLATECANRALAIDPSEFEALCAAVKVAMAANDFRRAEEFLQRLLKLKKLASDDRATVLGLLGDLRHAQMKFAEAFKAYGAANIEKRNHFGPHFQRPPGQRFSDYVQWLSACFETRAHLA